MCDRTANETVLWLGIGAFVNGGADYSGMSSGKTTGSLNAIKVNTP